MWIDAVRLGRQEFAWMPLKTSRICSVHFAEKDFYKSLKGYTMLHKTAVPVCTVRTPYFITSLNNFVLILIFLH